MTPENRAADKQFANIFRLRSLIFHLFSFLAVSLTHPAEAAPPPGFADSIAPLLKDRCVKCHGPAKAEARLDLSTAAGIARGGKNGPVVSPHQPDESLLWERIDADEMPPKQPLTISEKEQVRQWITAGSPGLVTSANEAEHWAFRKLSDLKPPAVKNAEICRNPIDQFIQAVLEKNGQSLSPEASRERLIRRVALSITGLPPTTEEIKMFVRDSSPSAYASMVDRYLASPRYGEKWGKHWLDAAGYADSNGYFNADSDRPMAFRYRDYVIQALNTDLSFDQFIREQLAGDELSGFVPGQPAPAHVARQLIATHFLRNGQDGSGESDGNPDELRVDRYTALESCQQIVATALLGLTMQCAKCHSHKFEPITHQDYYRFQAIFDPVFPAATEKIWVKPQARFIQAPTAEQKRLWDYESASAETALKVASAQFKEWVSKNRPAGEQLFLDNFDDSKSLAIQWSNTAPGDDKPGGKPPVTVDSDKAPSARIRSGHLEIVAGVTLDSWLTTKEKFDWTPDSVGESVQVTFDLIDTRIDGKGASAERVGYFLATHDFDDSGPVKGGNILIDGHPTSSTSVWVDYPGKDAVSKGSIGKTGYSGGRNYGVRITNIGKGQFRLEHLLDGFPEDGSVTLVADDLPDGGFGFEYHANRSFIIDHILFERFSAASGNDVLKKSKAILAEYDKRKTELDQARKKARDLRENPPFKIAWASDVSANPPATHLLTRGNYAQPGEVVHAAPPSALAQPGTVFSADAGSGRTTKRRLSLANWLTNPQEKASALMARVQVNRVWQAYFGTGIVTTPDNLGLSGAPPTHPELLDWLAHEFVLSGWSMKHLHRLILASATFRQQSDDDRKTPSDERLLGQFPAVRLEAETIRDAMLAVSGELDTHMGGPYVPIQARDDGAIVVAESQPGSRRRSIYLQQRRTQVMSMLQLFDAPTIVFNSLKRPRTAMPLQSLTLLNSEFVRARAAAFSQRLVHEAPAAEESRLVHAWQLAYARSPLADEIAAAVAFLASQKAYYGSDKAAADKAWVDLCQTILMSNEFLYID